MSKVIKKRLPLVLLLLGFSACFFYLTSYGSAAQKDLKGRPFTDPSAQVEMPADWVKKPVKYEKGSEDADITITLEQDMYHTILPIIQQYGKENNLKIAIKEGTCGIAAGMLSRKAIDIGGFCCPPGKEDRLPGIKFHTLGIVAKAILVHPSNPIDNVTISQARDIFRGKILKWSELKDKKGATGPDWNILPIGRFHCLARPGHWYLLLPDEKMFSPMLYEVGAIPDMISRVGANRASIGWEVLSMVEHYQSLGKVKAIKIDGHAPTDLEAIAENKYPLYRTYNLTTWEGRGVENIKAQKLVDFIMKNSESLDPKFGFVPASELRKAGWKFKANELTGEP